MMIYRLTEEERDMALREAMRRQDFHEKERTPGRNGGASTGRLALFYHQVGAAGEVAVASYLGLKDHLFDPGGPVRGSCDLPYNIDVKTRTKHYYDLIVQLDDVSTKNYWLVTIQNKEIRIHGWIHHSDCTKEEYIKDPAGGRTAFFVPQKALHSPETFFTVNRLDDRDIS